MAKTLEELFEEGRLYAAYSIKTGKPFLDENRTVHIFQTAADAEKFCMLYEGVYTEGPFYPKCRRFLSQAYAMGATHVSAAEEGCEPFRHPIREQAVLRHRYYNPETNFVVIMLKQTRFRRYLKELRGKTVIVPAKLDNTDEGVDVHYAIATRKKDGDFLYVVFSDLDEYRAWSESVAGWEPLAMKYEAFRKASKGHGFVLNPSGTYFLVTRKFVDTD